MISLVLAAVGLATPAAAIECRSVEGMYLGEAISVTRSARLGYDAYAKAATITLGGAKVGGGRFDGAGVVSAKFRCEEKDRKLQCANENKTPHLLLVDGRTMTELIWVRWLSGR